MLGIGFAIAIIFNVDTLRIVDAVSKNPNLAKAVAAEAESYASSHNPTSDGTNRGNGERKLEEAIARLEDSGIPMGWNAAEWKYLGLERKEVTCGLLWSERCLIFMQVGGWFLTALAASLGAPFWFDVLSRFVNLRNAGKDPNEKDPITSVKASGQANLNKTPCANAR